ncbi:MAG: hypothetical protein AAFV53_29975 [Myxococcota bacterium]
MVASVLFSSMLLQPVHAGGLGAPDDILLEDLHDARYCEVIGVSVERGPTFPADVYNTVGNNDCPAESWDELTARDAAETMGTPIGILNGPRHFVIDAVSKPADDVPPPTIELNGMVMTYIASLDLSASDVSRKAYEVEPVERDNVWIYDRGTTIFELTDPDGNVYVMQSYSLEIDPDLTIDDLEHLALDLPEGWSYGARVLRATLELDAAGEALVLQDEYRNSYMLNR